MWMYLDLDLNSISLLMEIPEVAHYRPIVASWLQSYWNLSLLKVTIASTGLLGVLKRYKMRLNACTFLNFQLTFYLNIYLDGVPISIRSLIGCRVKLQSDRPIVSSDYF